MSLRAGCVLPVSVCADGWPTADTEDHSWLLPGQEWEGFQALIPLEACIGRTPDSALDPMYFSQVSHGQTVVLELVLFV